MHDTTIVVHGSPSDGFQFTGPFADSNDAIDWAEGLNDAWWIAELDRPEFSNDEGREN